MQKRLCMRKDNCPPINQCSRWKTHWYQQQSGRGQRGWGQWRGRGRRGRGRDKWDEDKCYRYGKMGHWARDCTLPDPEAQSIFTAYGFINYSKRFWAACLICAKHNPQGNVWPKWGQFPPSNERFEQIHMDLIERNECEGGVLFSNYRFFLQMGWDLPRKPSWCSSDGQNIMQGDTSPFWDS